MIRPRSRRSKARAALLALVAPLVLGLAQTARAQGGPPLITDDPWSRHRLELLAEIHEEKRKSAPAEVLYNLGGRYKITPRLTLMLATGHAFRGPAEERPRLLFLAGVQLNLPGTYRFGGRELPAEAVADRTGGA